MAPQPGRSGRPNFSPDVWPILPGRVTQANTVLQQCKVRDPWSSVFLQMLSPSWVMPIGKQQTPIPHPVLSYIIGEMTRNAASDAVKEIREINDAANNLLVLLLSPPVAEIEKARAYDKWIDLVNEGHVWDHKHYIRKTWTSYQTIDFQIIGKAEKIQFFLDIWSNIHYGYVGLAAAFTEFELIEGSNAQSLWHNHSPDPPSDVASIKIGFRLFDGTLSVPALLKELYAHSHELDGKPVK